MREGWQSVELGSFVERGSLMEFKNGLSAGKVAYGSGVKFVKVMDTFRRSGSTLMPVPTLERQKAVAQVLNAAQVEISLLNDEIKALTRQMRVLMQKLLTDEWRVEISDDEEVAP